MCEFPQHAPGEKRRAVKSIERWLDCHAGAMVSATFAETKSAARGSERIIEQSFDATASVPLPSDPLPWSDALTASGRGETLANITRMTIPHLRILDTDGSVDAQMLRDAAPWASTSEMDLRDLGPALRLWSRRKTIDIARARLAQAGDLRPSVSFLGSGDFHHLAVLLIERVREPLSVLHIDNHPDWVKLAPRWHCGSWINRVLELPNVQRVVTVGPCSDDLVDPARKGGNLAALDAGRLVLFPWQHAPSRVRRRIQDGRGHEWRNGALHWRNLAERQLLEACGMVVAALPETAVWITIDKDVLPEDEALTNWDQGRMPLAAVLETIRAVAAARRVIGADVCGEYSPPAHANWFKRIEARMDQPRRRSNADALTANSRTDSALAAALFEACNRSTLQ